MKRRVFNILAGISLAIGTALLVAWPISCIEKCDMSIGGNMHLRMEAGTVCVYNGGEPYAGSIIGIAGANSPRNPTPQTIAWDFPGIYFRHFDWSDPGPRPWPGCTYWLTVRIHLVYPLALAAVLPAAWGIGWSRRNRRVRDGRCVQCGYDLRATPERCPECGRPVLSSQETR